METYFADRIPDKPENEYKKEAADRLLAVAQTYLDNAEKLIYSYGSRTFLSGFALYDPAYGGRGNIDCSTFVLLVLSGIPYEKSPYATGSSQNLNDLRAPWADPALTDYSNLPERFIDIAERIGRPYLAGPKGLDLEKAEAMGISVKTLGEEIRKTGVGRRSAAITRYFLERGECFADQEMRQPGDIVFYRNPGFFREGDRKFKTEETITHVGIVWKDTAFMVNSAGYVKKERAEEEGLPAVALAPVYGKRTPAFFARPAN